jgi:hypothetical protein
MQLRFIHPFGAQVSAVVGAMALAACVVCVFLGGFGWELKRAERQFQARHLEASGAIEYAYAYFQAHGRWPPSNIAAAADHAWLPPDWQYESLVDEEGGPRIWLHGPYHMILSYRFSPPQQGAISAAWTLSVEGDKTVFSSDARYQPAGHGPGQ